MFVAEEAFVVSHIHELSGLDPIRYNPLPREYQNGKFIRSSRAVEEGTEKSTAGSRTLCRSTCGFGKLGIERAAYIVGVGTQAH
jgi:hypothetical protein